MTSTPTRSDAGLATALRISVSRLARRLRVERTAPGQVEPVLSDTQFAALATLEKQGPMSPGELASHERVQPPSMTRVIAALEGWQLVTRSAHASDRRQVVLTVTPAGRELVVRARRVHWVPPYPPRGHHRPTRQLTQQRCPPPETSFSRLQ